MSGDIRMLEARFLGDQPPIAAGARGEPDRRQISFRWLAGAVLAGLTSLLLMGGALFAALDGRQQLAQPAQAFLSELLGPGRHSQSPVAKGGRPGLNLNISRSDSNVMMVSTVTRDGDREVIKVRPFLHIRAPLAVAPSRELNYPPFDPLAVFSESGETQAVAKSNDLIYGAEVESEVSIRVVEFPSSLLSEPFAARQRADEIEEFVRRSMPGLDAQTASLAALPDIDPARFLVDGLIAPQGSDVTITAENVSIFSKTDPTATKWYDDQLVRIRDEADLASVLMGEGMAEEQAQRLQAVLSSDIGNQPLRPGDSLRISYEVDKADDVGQPSNRASRISVYRGSNHLVSVARSDHGQFVYADEPDMIPELTQGDIDRPIVSRLPSTYDGIYRAALTEGLTADLARALVRVFAFDVDFRSVIAPTDELSVFLSLEDDHDTPSAQSEILYASIRLGDVTRRYYRFRDSETGLIDYYDETGRSAKKFLLRKPVPNGTFRSPFGVRRHPISGLRRMHWGADWAAPRGTPIVAAGNGVVEKAGWAGGHGKRTIIRHANGYMTSYSHQSTIAKGVAPGARVRQGQIIGTVGSTGYSTGPHLHYEVIVNGNKVDPMRIRLPRGKTLQGEELAQFEAERDRIDNLVREREEGGTQLALN